MASQRVERWDAVVVGGGLAGIAAAARLRERGVRALLLEAASELGGKLRSRGPIAWDAKHDAMARLARMLGVAGAVVDAAAGARYVVRKGALAAVDAHPFALLTSSALSLRARLDLLREPMRAAGGAAVDDESVASFFRRRFGRDVTEGLLFAMTNGNWAGDPERLSAALCFPELVDAERTHGSVLRGALEGALRRRELPQQRRHLTLREGLASLGAAAAGALTVKRGVRVESLELKNGSLANSGVVLRCSAVDGSIIIEASAVVVAVDAPAARSLLSSTGAREKLERADGILGDVSYAPLTIVHWREKRPSSSRLPYGHGWVAPPRERTFSLGTRFASPSGGEGARSFSAFVGGTLTPERARLTDDELVERVAAELRTLTGGVFGEVVDIERQPQAVAQPTLGHASRMAELRAALADVPVVLAGSWLGAGAMKDAVESGFGAADDVAERLAFLSKQRAEARVSPPSATEDAPTAADRRKAERSLAVVGASYRDVATEIRARLASAERGDDAPSRALVEAGYADGVVVLETCSRVEWIISSSRPAWAAEILKSTLQRRVPDGRLHQKTGHAAAHYLLRVAMGLDSVAEGEPAVGRQLVLAFERAHKDGVADRSLRLAWRSVQALLGDRRKRGVVRHGLGVQTLVVEELQTRGIGAGDDILVFGQGEIGRACLNAIREAGFTKVEAHRRATHAQFLERAESARAVVVCTGGPSAFLALPLRKPDAKAAAPVVVDVGVPIQVSAAPGWISVPLEDLLMRPRRLLDDDTRAWLVEAVAGAADKLTKDLADPAPATALSLIDEERRVFLRETLPPLLEKLQLPPSSAEEVRRACAAFAHHLMERVRDGGAA